MPVSREPAFVVEVPPLMCQLANELDPRLADPAGAAISMFETPIGTLELARAVSVANLSDRILAADADAAAFLMEARRSEADLVLRMGRRDSV